MNETELFKYPYDNCHYRDIYGAFITAWIWVFFNKFIIGVTFCYGSAITHINVYAEYAVVWLICIFNFISCCLIIEWFFDGYYYSNAITKLKASLAMSCLALIFSILVAIQVIRELCKAKNQQVRANVVAETSVTTQQLQQPVVVQSVQPPPLQPVPVTTGK